MTEGHTPDLIERLRHNSGWRNTDHHCVTSPGLLTEAADEIAALRDRVAALEGALRRAREGFSAIDSCALGHLNEADEARSILSRAQQGNEFSLSRQQGRMDDVAALREIHSVVSEYLPPDGIEAKACISKILAVLDRPAIANTLGRHAYGRD